eukprot:1957589-Rhodomonas_salina.1
MSRASFVPLISSQSVNRVGFMAHTMRPLSSRTESSPPYLGTKPRPTLCFERCQLVPASASFALVAWTSNQPSGLSFAWARFLPPGLANLVVEKLHDALVRPLVGVGGMHPGHVIGQLVVQPLDWDPNSSRRGVRAPKWG